MNLLLQRQQSYLRQLRQRETTIDVKEFFDEVIRFLNHSSNDRNDCLTLLTGICNEFAGLSVFRSFDHPFFPLLRQTFEMLLTKLLFMPLSSIEEQCLDGISLFIHRSCLQTIDYQPIFLTDSVMKKIVGLFNDIRRNDYESFDIRYKVLDRFVHLLIKFYDISNPSIIDSILQCLKSDICIQLYQTTQFHQSILTPKQAFFMYQCPKFISICRDENTNDILNFLREHFIQNTFIICTRHLPTDSNTNEDPGLKMRVVAWYIEFLNHFALNPDVRICFKEKRYADQSIIDLVLSILQNELYTKDLAFHLESLHADAALISYALTLLYNLIYERTILEKLKKDNFVEICQQFSLVDDRTIVFTSQTLYTILTEEHIDHMKHPSEIARSYLYIIENTIDDVALMFHGIKLDGVLTHLEDIVQNDQIKEEIINDEEGIPLLARCVYQDNLDFMTIQQPALRIIHGISFGSDLAVEQIKENDLLMEYIKELEKRTAIPEVKRLLWKTEEDDFIERQESRKKSPPKRTKTVFDEKNALYQYVRGDHRFRVGDPEPIEKFDVLLSYCYEDREVVKRLYQRLMESDSCQVFFDVDYRHSSNPKAMAEAVEQSMKIVMCFSNAYRNSYACRLEAEYAKKRKRVIIPVKLTDYEQTGWVDDIIGENIVIDYSRESNKAFEQIDESIKENK